MADFFGYDCQHDHSQSEADETRQLFHLVFVINLGLLDVLHDIELRHQSLVQASDEKPIQSAEFSMFLIISITSTPLVLSSDADVLLSLNFGGRARNHEGWRNSVRSLRDGLQLLRVFLPQKLLYIEPFYSFFPCLGYDTFFQLRDLLNGIAVTFGDYRDNVALVMQLF